MKDKLCIKRKHEQKANIIEKNNLNIESIHNAMNTKVVSFKHLINKLFHKKTQIIKLVLTQTRFKNPEKSVNTKLIGGTLNTIGHRVDIIHIFNKHIILC